MSVLVFGYKLQKRYDQYTRRSFFCNAVFFIGYKRGAACASLWLLGLRLLEKVTNAQKVAKTVFFALYFDRFWALFAIKVAKPLLFALHFDQI